MPTWARGQLGFNTQRELWFVDYFDRKGQSAGFNMARHVDIRHGTTYHAAWPDNGLNPDGSPDPNRRDFYHIREEFRAELVKRVAIEDSTIVVEFVRGKMPDELSEPPTPLHDDAVAVQMAYSTADGRGFVEEVDRNGLVLRRLDQKWLMTENLTQATVGSWQPDRAIRLRTERADFLGYVITGTTCVIVGKANGNE
jgi:hypothetical protein